MERTLAYRLSVSLKDVTDIHWQQGFPWKRTSGL